MLVFVLLRTRGFLPVVCDGFFFIVGLFGLACLCWGPDLVKMILFGFWLIAWPELVVKPVLSWEAELVAVALLGWRCCCLSLLLLLVFMVVSRS